MRSTIAELENAVRLFSQLSAASNLHFHGFDEKKIDTHIDYCKNVLAAAKPHLEAAIREEQQIRQRQEVARQHALAEEASRKAEEQRKFQVCLLYTLNIYGCCARTHSLSPICSKFTDTLCENSWRGESKRMS